MSEKNRDAKNRWRTVTVAFRLSPEENEELTTLTLTDCCCHLLGHRKKMRNLLPV